jgi:hypothetical protein
MAQSFPTSAEIIYNTLSGDSSFTAMLGTYTFKGNTSTLPAISILSAGQDLPGLNNVGGVECIIQDTGDIIKNEYLTGDAARLTVVWSVFLIAWGNTTGTQLQTAAEKVCSHFLGSQSIQTVATSDGLGSTVQTKVLINSDMPIIS